MKLSILKNGPIRDEKAQNSALVVHWANRVPHTEMQVPSLRTRMCQALWQATLNHSMKDAGSSDLLRTSSIHCSAQNIQKDTLFQELSPKFVIIKPDIARKHYSLLCRNCVRHGFSHILKCNSAEYCSLFSST
jgi:hypothetical protein